MSTDAVIKKAEKEILGNFLDILNSHTSKGTALKAALAEIVSIDWLPIEPKGGMFLVSKDNPEQLSLYTTTSNFSPELLTLCKKVDFGYCICGRAASSKKIMFVDCVDEKHDTRFDGISPHGHYSVPFFNSDEELLGVFVLYVPHGHKYKEEEAQYLEFVAKGLGSICQRFDQEEEARELDRRLKHQEKMNFIGDMAAGIAHEVNTPLGTISLLISRFGKIISKEIDDSEKVEKIEKSIPKVTLAIERISKIINNLRRVNVNTDNEPMSSRILNDLIEDALVFCNHGLREDKVTFENAISDSLRAICMPVSLTRVFVSLFENSREAIKNESEKWIRVSAEESDEEVIIAVTDNGKIDPELANKIFTPLFTTKEVGAGTGIGLSTSHGMVKSMSGELTLDLTQKNTTFLIKLKKA